MGKKGSVESDPMKILLIKPPQNPSLATNSVYEPLDLEYLAASVPGAEVRILDMRIENRLMQELTGFRPDLVGIGAYTCDYNTTVDLLGRIKKYEATIRTVVGGHHATFLPSDFALTCVDAVFLGYADTTFPMYVEAFNDRDRIRNIPNLALVENGSITFTRKETFEPDLKTLPLPDRSKTKRYRKYYHDPLLNRMALVMTSRGCPYRCNFCACWKLMNGKYASRTPESIVEELRSLPVEDEIVYFSDDNTFHDIGRMWKLSELIRTNGVRKKLQMYARADTIVKHGELFSDLVKSGLKFITIGIESFQNEDLDYFRKKTTVDINNQAIRILKKLDIYILAHFVVRPQYSENDFDRLMDYVYDNNLFRPAFPVLTPLPGTDLYADTRNDFVVTNLDLFDFAHSILPTRLESKVFYRRLTSLYVKSFSAWRYLKHRFWRGISSNLPRYYTDNTDGITLTRLLLLYLYTLKSFIKLRYSPVKNHSSFIPK